MTRVYESRPFVGRADVLARLMAAYRAAAAGRPAVLVVEGPPGIGKSSVLARLGAWLAGDSPTDDGPGSLGDRPAGAVPPTEVAAVTAERDEAGLAYGVLNRVLARFGPGADLPATVDPFAAGLTLLERLAAGGPVRVVVVDDVQWSDAVSLRALAFAVRRLRDEPVLVVLGLRTGEEIPDDLGRMLAHPATERLPLDGLDVEATAALCAALTGAAVAPSAAARLHEGTAGNPLWLTAVVAAGGRLGRLTPGQPLPPPDDFAELIRRQLAGGDPDVRALAVAVAVSGPVSVREVVGPYEAAGGTLGGGWPDHVVGRAVAERLVAEHHGSLRAYHALTASAIYWSLPTHERARLHTVAAGVLDDPDRRLDHRCVADAVLTADPRLADDLLTRAAVLRAAGNAARAAALTLAAADRVAHERRAGLRTRAGLDLLRAGDLARAAQIADAEPEAADTAAGLALRGSLALLQGRRAEADTLLRRGFAAAGEDEVIAGVCAAQLTALVINMGLGQETLRWARRSAELTPSDGMAQLMLYASEGVLIDSADHPWPSAAEPPAALAGALSGRGVQALWRGDEASAYRYLREGQLLALREGPIIVGVIGGYYLTEAAYRLGDHRGALEVSDTNLSLAHDAEMTWTWTLAHATRVAPLIALGRLAEAREHVEIARAHSSGDFAAVLWIAVAGARLALAEGDPVRALTELAAMGPYEQVAGAGNPAIQPWGLLQATALLRTGRPVEADVLLVPMEESLAQWPRAWVAAQAARLRAELHRAAGDPAAAEEVLRRAVATLGGRPSWEAASLRADHGALLRRRGQRAGAGVELRAAYEQLAEMGADTAEVAAELAVLEGRSRSGPLTGRERAIADLVAQGRTNREIGQSLHISVKTVEYHLGHAFAKLGVRSRGGVGAALARHDGA